MVIYSGLGPLRRGFLCLTIALSGCSTAQLHATSNALLVTDWAQTRYIAGHPQKYEETNKMLGAHPSKGSVNKYFIGYLALNNAIHYALPETKRKYWSLYVIADEAVAVDHNFNIGVRFNW